MLPYLILNYRNTPNDLKPNQSYVFKIYRLQSIFDGCKKKTDNTKNQLQPRVSNTDQILFLRCYKYFFVPTTNTVSIEMKLPSPTNSKIRWIAVTMPSELQSLKKGVHRFFHTRSNAYITKSKACNCGGSVYGILCILYTQIVQIITTPYLV